MRLDKNGRRKETGHLKIKDGSKSVLTRATLNGGNNVGNNGNNEKA